MGARRKKSTDLRAACIQEALAVVEKHGIEQLSLREVARRLGVSHQAPYKHFPSRDHILAEIVSRAYKEFANHLESRPRSGDAQADLEAMGRAYIEYAFTHPLQYRLMFGTPLPNPAQHPNMMNNAQHAFRLLQSGIEALHNSQDRIISPYRRDFDALFVWSTLHGLCSVVQSHALNTLNLPKDLLDSMVAEMMERIGFGLQAAPNENKHKAGKSMT